MGYTENTAILVTAHDLQQLQVAWRKARQLFPTLTSEVVPFPKRETPATTHQGGTFMVAPQGYKFGSKPQSDHCEACDVFIEWLRSEAEQAADDDLSRLEWVEVIYSHDRDGPVARIDRNEWD